MLLASVAAMAKKDKKVEVVAPVAPVEVVAAAPTMEQNISYALGANFGTSIITLRDNYSFDLDTNFLVKGMLDAYGKRLKMSTEDIRDIFSELDKMVKERENAKLAVTKRAGEMFLEMNRNAAGIRETASGLQYKVITEGKGPKPTASSTVKVHYHGTTIDGQVFDSSVQRGEPITFQLNQVIEGWKEGLQLMTVGSKYIFYIPSKLAYGDRGAGDVIPGGAALIFEIELLDIEK